LKNFLQMKSKPSSNRRRHKNSANVEFQAFQRTFIKNNAILLIIDININRKKRIYVSNNLKNAFSKIQPILIVKSNIV
jgi:hypothetical protein